MREIYFLGRVLEKSDNKYLIALNKNSINSFPEDNISTRTITSEDDLDLGAIYYFYKAELDEIKKTVHIPLGHYTKVEKPGKTENNITPVLEVSLTDTDRKNINNVYITPSKII